MAETVQEAMKRILGKQRPLYRGNALLTTQHINYFKPLIVPTEVVESNLGLRETITVNPLTSEVTVRGLFAVFMDPRKGKYTKKWRYFKPTRTYKEVLDKAGIPNGPGLLVRNITKEEYEIATGENTVAVLDDVMPITIKKENIKSIVSLSLNNYKLDYDTSVLTKQTFPYTNIPYGNLAQIPADNVDTTNKLGLFQRDVVTYLGGNYNYTSDFNIYNPELSRLNKLTLNSAANLTLNVYSSSSQYFFDSSNYNADLKTYLIALTNYEYVFTPNTDDLVSFYEDLVNGELWNERYDVNEVKQLDVLSNELLTSSNGRTYVTIGRDNYDVPTTYIRASYNSFRPLSERSDSTTSVSLANNDFLFVKLESGEYKYMGDYLKERYNADFARNVTLTLSSSTLDQDYYNTGLSSVYGSNVGDKTYSTNLNFTTAAEITGFNYEYNSNLVNTGVTRNIPWPNASEYKGYYPVHHTKINVDELHVPLLGDKTLYNLTPNTDLANSNLNNIVSRLGNKVDASAYGYGIYRTRETYYLPDHVFIRGTTQAANVGMYSLNYLSKLNYCIINHSAYTGSSANNFESFMEAMRFMRASFASILSGGNSLGVKFNIYPFIHPYSSSVLTNELELSSLYYTNSDDYRNFVREVKALPPMYDTIVNGDDFHSFLFLFPLSRKMTINYRGKTYTFINRLFVDNNFNSLTAAEINNIISYPNASPVPAFCYNYIPNCMVDSAKIQTATNQARPSENFQYGSNPVPLIMRGYTPKTKYRNHRPLNGLFSATTDYSAFYINNFQYDPSDSYGTNTSPHGYGYSWTSLLDGVGRLSYLTTQNALSYLFCEYVSVVGLGGVNYLDGVEILTKASSEARELGSFFDSGYDAFVANEINNFTFFNGIDGISNHGWTKASSGKYVPEVDKYKANRPLASVVGHSVASTFSGVFFDDYITGELNNVSFTVTLEFDKYGLDPKTTLEGVPNTFETKTYRIQGKTPRPYRTIPM